MRWRAARRPHLIVLIHGTSGSLHTWGGWIAALKEEPRVVSFDLPGFGLTGPFPDYDYRIEHYTRFMGDLLDQVGVKHTVLVGNFPWWPHRLADCASQAESRRPSGADQLRGYLGQPAISPSIALCYLMYEGVYTRSHPDHERHPYLKHIPLYPRA